MAMEERVVLDFESLNMIPSSSMTLLAALIRACLNAKFILRSAKFTHHQPRELPPYVQSEADIALSSMG